MYLNNDDMKKREIIFGAILCFAGGAIDGYSYVMRGGYWLLLRAKLAYEKIYNMDKFR